MADTLCALSNTRSTAMLAINTACVSVGADYARPTILAIYSDWAEGQLIADYLSDKEHNYNYLIVGTREASLAALTYRPNLILVDVLLSQMGISLQLQNLHVALKMKLISQKEIN